MKSIFFGQNYPFSNYFNPYLTLVFKIKKIKDKNVISVRIDFKYISCGGLNVQFFMLNKKFRTFENRVLYY